MPLLDDDTRTARARVIVQTRCRSEQMAGVSRYFQVEVLSCLVTAERLGAASSQLFKERDPVQAFNLQYVGDAYSITAVELGHALRAPEAP